MIDNGKRYCDRCGKILTRDNNKCGYEVCDTCNEQLERVKAEMREKLFKAESEVRNDKRESFNIGTKDS